MPKHARKKQKLEKDVQPLGAVRRLDDEAEKDEEERRLESLLFGTDFKPGGKGKGTGLYDDVILVEDEEVAEGEVGNALEYVQDKDLFFLDDGQTGIAQRTPKPDSYVEDDEGENDLHESIPRSEKDNGEHQHDVFNTSTILRNSLPTHSQQKPAVKKSAWIDPDDVTLSVSLATTKRLRKLRDAPAEDVVGGTQYEIRLRREFERINPLPEWATKARKKAREERKRKHDGLVEMGGEDDIEMDDLLASTDGVLETKRGSRLDKGMIGVERLRDVNQSARAEGEIKALAFHPSPRVPVLMTASTDRRLRLFTVDGHTNPHLQTIHVPELPITHAEFHPGGSSILLTGPRPFYYTFDLQSGVTTRSPRGLWGSNPAHSSAKAVDMGMERVAFDPSGDILAVAGRRGYVHLVDWRAGGAQVIGSVKMNSGVQALWWNRHTGLDGRPELMTLGADAEVYVWDVGERSCVKLWKEEGGYGTTVMSGDSSGRYLSIGSKSGLVNVYGEDASLSTSSSTPKPQKTLQNLTTSISTLQFNHDSQLLAMASSVKKDQMRLVHLPSLTAFSNWPTSSTPLGHVTAIDFSRNSEYIAIGNNRGRALLYQFSHFVNTY